MKLLPSAFLQKLFNKNNNTARCGISIHADVVRLVKLEQRDEGLFCSATDELPFANDEQLPLVMAKLIDKYQLDDCVSSIVLPTTRLQSSQIEQKELPEHDVQNALPWQCKELFSIPPQDMLCDYIDMPLQPFGQAAKAQVFATSKKYIEKVIAPFHEKGAELNVITTEQFALAKLQKSKDAAQLAFIQHKNSEGILLILKNQQICFARKLRGTDSIIEMNDEQLQAGGTDNLVIELQRSIDFYESQLKQPPIKNAYISIHGNNEDSVIKALNLTLPVRAKVFLVDNITNTEVINQKLLAALGVALPDVVIAQEEVVNEV